MTSYQNEENRSVSRSDRFQTINDKPWGLASLRDAYNKAVLEPLKLSPEMERQLKALTAPSMDIDKSKLPDFIKSLKGENVEKPIVVNRIDFIEDVLAALAMSSYEDSKLFKTLLGVMSTELAALKNGSNPSAAEIEKMKADIEECQRLVNERPNLTIENNISIDSSVITDPKAKDHQENEESKNWFAKLSSTLKHPSWLSFQGFLQTILGYTCIVVILLWLGWQQSAINYLQKQLPPIKQEQPVSEVNQTFQGLPDSYRPDSYTGSRTHSRSPEDASRKRGDKSPTRPASE